MLPPWGLSCSRLSPSFVLLSSDLDLATAEALERSVEQLNLSALVVDIGGIATYPPLIPRDLPPLAAIETAAHEWTHNALFLTPLGLAYERSTEARAINETTADLVGSEIASAIASQFEIAPRPVGGGGRARQLREALQRIRTVADQMLARGEVEGAEAFMEAERRSLVEQGFTIRRLNQAYFAFNGNYVQGPVRSTEIPDGLRVLRARSTSLGDFVRRVGKITSAEELRRAAYD
ncbi:MAG: hypothetical protein HW416_1897 [Chloroflexi bacterium]|nr:hypothetical protein [Chloroflexota bacterium]